MNPPFFSRRDFIKNTTLAALTTSLVGASAVQNEMPSPKAFAPAAPLELPENSVELRWLERHPPAGGQPADVTWGVPWARGALPRDTQFTLQTETGDAVPVQSWPLAFWPDGTLKWSAHAARTGGVDRYVLKAGGRIATSGLKISETTDAIMIDTGVIACRLNRTGENIFSEIARAGRITAQNGAFICLVENTPAWNGTQTRTRTEFHGKLEKATIEQNGPLRAVVKLEGRHFGPDGRVWLPFSLRLYFYAGSEAIRAVHTFIYDGDQHRDFIAGLGFTFSVPMTDEWHNRHVRFVGEDGGLWGESVRNLPGWADPFVPKELYAKQLAGEPVQALARFDAKTREQIESVAAWTDFKLTQTSGTAFAVTKRTHEKSSWVGSGHGSRSAGTGYVGGVSGGVAFGLRDFWQRHPSQLEINHALTDTSRVTLWFWSPDAGPMDLRHYDIKGHALDVNYEDYEEGHSTPYGIASSHEFRLWILPATPARERLVELSAQAQTPALLVCRPERYHALQTFGVWSLPDRSHPSKAKIEDQLDHTINFYHEERDRRGWDGYWNYGDIRHRYDGDRHEWRYDVGGYAWDNNEMVPEFWLWYFFLRSGRADVFRMAEALSHHTRDVDMYHIGPFAPFGSRHNVSHWGCGAKEPRISMAALKRPYYYMTADERTGDVMHEVIDADQKLIDLDPMRKVLPKSEYPAHMRSGPDWFGMASNWLAAWERTGDTRYRDRIVTGLRNLAAMPHGMASGTAFGYNPADHTLHYIGDDNYKFLMVAPFGGPEVVFELQSLINEPEWNRAWLEFCEIYNAGKEEQIRRAGRAMETTFPVWNARLTAYAAHSKKDPALGRRAWQEFLHGEHHDFARRYPLLPRQITGPETLNHGEEFPWMETNHAVQWSLNAMELLAFAGDEIPSNLGKDW